MHAEYENSNTAGSEAIITNLVSLTLILSTVVFLGAVCRMLKRCCARYSKNRKPNKDVIAFREVRRISHLRKCFAASKTSSQDYSVVHQEEPRINIQEPASVQPKLGVLEEEVFAKPRALTYPGQKV